MINIRNDKYYNIKALNGKFLTVENNSYQLRAKLVLSDQCDSGSAQFRIEKIDESWRFLLRSRNSGLPVFVNGYWGDPDSILRQGDVIEQRQATAFREDYRLSLRQLPNGKYYFPLFPHETGAVDETPVVQTPDGNGVYIKPISEPAENHPLAHFELVMTTKWDAPTTAQSLITADDEDKPLKYIRAVAGAAVNSIAKKALKGGAPLMEFAFDLILANEDEKSESEKIVDILTEFRADILDVVDKGTQANNVKNASAELKVARQHYLINYRNKRNGFFSADGQSKDPASNLVSTLESISSDIKKALAGLHPDRSKGPDRSEGVIIKSDTNAYLVRAGLPLYIVGAMEHLNLIQESALLQAVLSVGGSFSYEDDLKTLEEHAQIHMTQISEMYDFVLGWRQEQVTMNRFTKDDYFVKLRDNVVGKTLIQFSGGGVEGYVREVVKPLQDAYRAHLSFNYYNYEYAYWKEFKQMGEIAKVTERMCHALVEDEELRSKFSAPVEPIAWRAVYNQTHSSQTLENVKGPNVVRVRFGRLPGKSYADIDTGFFAQVGDKLWQEQLLNTSKLFDFREVQRDEWSVDLIDDSRQVMFQLDLYRKEVIFSDENGDRSVSNKIKVSYAVPGWSSV